MRRIFLEGFLLGINSCWYHGASDGHHRQDALNFRKINMCLYQCISLQKSKLTYHQEQRGVVVEVHVDIFSDDEFIG